MLLLLGLLLPWLLLRGQVVEALGAAECVRSSCRSGHRRNRIPALLQHSNLVPCSLELVWCDVGAPAKAASALMACTDIVAVQIEFISHLSQLQGTGSRGTNGRPIVTLLMSKFVRLWGMIDGLEATGQKQGIWPALLVV